MSNNSKWPMAAALLWMGFGAKAQDNLHFDGVMSLSASHLEAQTVSTNRSQMNIVSDAHFSDNFTMGFDLDYGRGTSDNYSATLTRFQFEPTVHLQDGLYVGSYYQNTRFESLNGGIDFESYGVFGGYDFQNWKIDGYLGATSAGYYLAPITLNDVGLTLTVRPVHNLEVFGHIAENNSNDEAPNTAPITLSAVGAEYTLRKGVTVYGAFAKFDLDGTTLSTVSLGADYDLSSIAVKIPGSVTLVVDQTRVENVRLNNITVGWLIPLGNGQVKPLNSVLRIAQGGIRSAIVAGFLSDGASGG